MYEKIYTCVIEKRLNAFENLNMQKGFCGQNKLAKISFKWSALKNDFLVDCKKFYSNKCILSDVKLIHHVN